MFMIVQPQYIFMVVHRGNKMNKKEKAQIERICKKIGLSEKQIKTLIKRAEKANLSGTVLATILSLGALYVMKGILAETADLFKDKKQKAVK